MRQTRTPQAGSLCSGIGGIDLGLERAGWQLAWQVKIDPGCRRVLQRHWPEVPRYSDLREIAPDDLTPVDLVAAGFPCQPVSYAGAGRAQEDPRWLWPEVARLLRGLRPGWVLLENVPGLLARGFGDVLGDLAALGYDAEWACVSAADVGAPHLRERVWVVAYPSSSGRGAHERDLRAGQPDADRRGPDVAYPDGHRGGEGRPEPSQRTGIRLPVGSGEPVADPDRLGPQGRDQAGRPPPGTPRAGAVADPAGRRGARRAAESGAPDGWRSPGLPQRPGWGIAESVLGGVLDGLPARVDGHRWPAPPDPANDSPQNDWEPPRTVTARTVHHRARRVSALGNAVVPQVAELIGRAILTAEQERGG